MRRVRGSWSAVVLWCALQACCWALEDEPTGNTLCDMQVCTCREHNSTVKYNKSKGGPLDIFCSCENTNWRVMHLLSPHPVPRDTTLIHVTACEEVAVTLIEVGDQKWGWPVGLVITDVERLSVSPGGAFYANHVLVRNVASVTELPLGVLRSASFPDRPIATFQLENVTVDVIKEGAFANVHITSLFEMRNVTVRKIEGHAFNVTVHNGEFTIADSTIGTIESQGLGVMTGSVTLERCSLGLIEPQGIRVISEHFVLANCTVHGPVRSFALDVQARAVGFVHNQLHQLEESALFSVRKADFFRDHPGQNWQFAFAGNYIRSAHPGSLNPNWTLDTRDLVQANVFEDCSCEAINWLNDATNELVPALTRNFYTTLLDSESVCDIEECALSVSQALDFYLFVKQSENVSQMCEVGISFQEICEHLHGVTSSVNITFTSIYSVITMLLIISLSL